jgi:hypothetical protein
LHKVKIYFGIVGESRIFIISNNKDKNVMTTQEQLTRFAELLSENPGISAYVEKDHIAGNYRGKAFETFEAWLDGFIVDDTKCPNLQTLVDRAIAKI